MYEFENKGVENCPGEVVITEIPGRMLHVTCKVCSLSAFTPKL